MCTTEQNFNAHRFERGTYIMNKIRLAIVAVIMLITGISLTVTGISDIIKLNGEIPDFNYDSMQNIRNGDLVQGYVWNIYGNYANTTTTETTMGIETSSYVSTEYFIMPLINEEDYEKDLYITIAAHDKLDRNTLYSICDATWEYMGGNEYATFPEMGIVAKVKKLDPEIEDYMVDWFMYDPAWFESESEARQHIICYQLQIFNPGSAYTSLAIGLIIIAVMAVIGVILYRKLRPVNNFSTGSMPYVPPQSAAPSSMGGISAPQSGFSEAYTPPAPSTACNTAPQNGFSENFTPPSPQPIPDIPQPVQPDDFFDKSKPVSIPVSAPAPTPVQEPAAQSEPDPQEIEIPQPVQPDEFFEKPEKKETPKPVTVKPMPVQQQEESQPKPKPEPESVSAEKINLAYAEESSVISNMDGLDTASLSLDDLGYYDTGSGASDDEDDMFDFSNDDYGEIDVNSIEISE